MSILDLISSMVDMGFSKQLSVISNQWLNYRRNREFGVLKRRRADIRLPFL